MSAIRTWESKLLLLPNEILSSILGQLTPPDLKSLRLCSSAATYFTEPVLFAQVTVVPHHKSFRGLICLTKHSRIRRYVKTLYYDHRWGNIARDLLEDVQRRTDDKSLRKSVARLSGGIVTRQDAQIEVAYLSRALSSLPSLTALCIGARGDRQFDTPRRFYDRLRKVAGGDYHSILKLLGSPDFTVQALGASSVFCSLYAIGKSVPKLHVDNSDYSIFSTASLVDFVGYALRKIRSLSLYFRYNALSARRDSLSRLAGVLRCLLQLEELELNLEGEQTFRYTDEGLRYKGLECDLQSTCSFLFPAPIHFPKLRRLTLLGVFAAEDELVELLTRHASTLSKLGLKNAVLIKPHGQDSIPCWVRTFKRFQTCLSLKEISLSGHFRNGTNQDWLLRNSTPSNTRKARLEAFIVIGGERPVEDAGVENLGSTTFVGDEFWEVTLPSEPTHGGDDSEGHGLAEFELTSDEERQLVQDATDGEWLGLNDGSYEDWEHY